MTKNKLEYKEIKIAPDPYLDDPEIYSPAVQEKLGKLKEFFEEYGIDTKDYPLELKAYPNYDEYMYTSPARDTRKWIDAVKDIYYKEKIGQDKRSAILTTIGKWDDMEKKDFFNWLKFYEEGAHLKYKYAQQMWYEGINPGYVLPFKKDAPVADTNHADDSLEEMSQTEKKRIIEQQRKKIIGRLDSIEKLLRSEDGQLFAQKEFETLLEIIYQLKKKIQLINKKSASTKLYDDMIVREANVLMKRGFNRAADLLYKLADDVPAAVPPAPPTTVSGAPTTVPGDQVGTDKNVDGVSGPLNNPPPAPVAAPPPGPPPPPPPPPASEGMEEFLKGLKGGNITSDKSDTNDLEVLDVDDLEVDDLEVIKEAQEAAPSPPEPSPEPAPAPPPPEENLEVTEDVAPKAPTDSNLEVKEEDSPTGNKPSSTAFDSAIDSAFKNIKVDDVVAKLEDLAKIFKTREVPRQLAFVDMMLDTLGISSFFPSLAEATNKSLESNQYILTRVEDILSKLRGTMETNEIDLTSETPTPPEMEALKGKLSEQDENEKAKKKMRKDLEDKKLQEQSKEAPEVEIEEDLSKPTEVAPPAAPPPAPAAPPK
jgi:hypothetical protein